MLGKFLGFESTRPEKNLKKGPDVLWQTAEEFDFVIEAKSKKDKDNVLYKCDHAQLLEAEHWFKEQYPEKDSLRVSAIPKTEAHWQATTTCTMAIKLENLLLMKQELTNYYNTLLDYNEINEGVCEKCFAQFDLSPKKLRSKFMQYFQSE